MQVDEPLSMSRKERERLSRRTAMLEAAQSVFAERGFGQSTLDEIASRAEFGKGTIYNYFPGGKEEMLFALLDELYDGLIELIESQFGESKHGIPFRDQVRDLLTRTFCFFGERDDLFLIAIKEAHRHLFGDDPEKAAYFSHQRERLVEAISAPLESAMNRGEIKTMPSNAVAHMLLGNINGCYTHVCLCNRYGNNEQELPGGAEENAEFMTTMLFDGLLTK
jgi:AcrR family transcriptional regulator